MIGPSIISFWRWVISFSFLVHGFHVKRKQIGRIRINDRHHERWSLVIAKGCKSVKWESWWYWHSYNYEFISYLFLVHGFHVKRKQIGRIRINGRHYERWSLVTAKGCKSVKWESWWYWQSHNYEFISHLILKTLPHIWSHFTELGYVWLRKVLRKEKKLLKK